MSFTGDLEHLPIVDVIQLLHATRKSGILRVSCRKGESQLVFKDGFIVSANHLNNSVRIGKILTDLGLITQEILDRTLEDQKNAGTDRKPLIITLVENGVVKERDAYKGLEQLIEMTVVEILTWKGGTFTLDVMPQSVADEYRYFPEKMSREINVDTQGILMNALRIFDERKRDGQIQEDESPEEDFILEPYSPDEEIPLISEDDLGLADLDQMEAKLPEVYAVLEDREPRSDQLQRLENIAPELTLLERESLVDFLGEFSDARKMKEVATRDDRPAQNILLLSRDELFSHCITSVCKDARISVFATNEEQDVGLVIERFKADRSIPILVLDHPKDAGGGLSVQKITELRSMIKKRYPQIGIIQLSSPHDFEFTMMSYRDGVRAVLPRPFRDEGKDGFVSDTIGFLRTFREYVTTYGVERQRFDISGLRSCIDSFRGLRGAPEAAYILLTYVAGIFARSVTLIVREKEMIAEKGIGIGGEEGSGPTRSSLAFRIPLSGPSLFQEVIDKGEVFLGDTHDSLVRESIFARIGAPESPAILLLPLRLMGKTVSITYGDFGAMGPVPVDVEQLEILAGHARMALENAIYRKKMEKTAVKD